MMPHTSSPRIDVDTLARYLGHNASLVEEAEVERWMSAYPEARALVQQLRAGAWRDREPQADLSEDLAVDVEAVWMQVERRKGLAVSDGRGRSTAGHIRSGSGRRGSAWWSVGITLSIIIVLAVAFGARRDQVNPAPQVYTTRAGQQSTVHLNDGSTVVLAPSTTVTFTSQSATVTGEAYFTIVPRQAHPFVVHTPQATIRVLGTGFSVRHYPRDGASRIVVQDGKVAVRTSMTARDVVLSARMLAQVRDSNLTVIPDIPVKDYLGWLDGHLVFRERPLRDVVTELARAYDAEIRVADSALAQQLVTVAVSVRTEPLVDVLSGIGLIANAHTTRSGNAFVLVAGRASRPVLEPKRFPQQEIQYGR